MNIIKKVIGNSFFQGSVFITTASFIGGFLNYLFNIFVGRALGPAGYGEITTLFSYLTILTIPVGVIVQLIIIKIGNKKDNVLYTSALINWLILKAKKYWLVTILVACLIPFVPQLTNLSPIIGYSLIPLVLLAYITGLYDGILQGLHVFFWASVIGIATIFIKFLGSVVVLYVWQQMGIIVIFLLLSSILKGVLSHIQLAKIVKHVSQKTPILNKNIIALITDPQILLTSISGAAILILSNADIIYVKKVFSADEAGIYGSWSLFAKVILYILGPLITVSFIFFSSKKNERYHRLVLLGGIILLLLSGFGAMLAYGLYGELIIGTLFGKSFFQLLPFLEWASFFGISYTMIIFMNNYYLAKGNKAAYILACSLPLYIGGLIFYGTDLSRVMLVNIWFSFGVLGLYLLAFVRMRFSTLLK